MIEFALADNIGGREEQQDKVAVWVTEAGDGILVVLADGMGGHSGGALASAAVMDAAEASWRTAQWVCPEEVLIQTSVRAHESVNSVGKANNVDCRSTMVALFVNAETATWCHVGDSRLYHFREGSLLSRTKDHSVVQLLVDMGEISDAEMCSHPDQNKLHRSVGGEKLCSAKVGSAPICKGDGFLLCSDGFWEVIETHEMAEILMAEDLGGTVRHSVGVAAGRGGGSGDNISLATVRIR